MANHVENLVQKLALLIVLILVSFCSSMSRSEKHPPGVFYYLSFAGYNIPLKPIDEIPKGEINQHKSYYIGHYNEKGQLDKFEKYLDGKLFFHHIYTYHNNGQIKQNKVFNGAEGKETIQNFDEKGKLISEP